MLAAGLQNHLSPAESKMISETHRGLLEELSELSFTAYEELKHHEKFIPYLENMSTLQYYGKANIGSRPGKRGSKKGKEVRRLKKELKRFGKGRKKRYEYQVEKKDKEDNPVLNLSFPTLHRDLARLKCYTASLPVCILSCVEKKNRHTARLSVYKTACLSAYHTCPDHYKRMHRCISKFTCIEDFILPTLTGPRCGLCGHTAGTSTNSKSRTRHLDAARGLTRQVQVFTREDTGLARGWFGGVSRGMREESGDAGRVTGLVLS